MEGEVVVGSEVCIQTTLTLASPFVQNLTRHQSPLQSTESHQAVLSF